MEESDRWAGAAINIDFTKLSSAAATLGRKTFPNWDYDGSRMTQHQKEYLEIAFPQAAGVQASSQPPIDKINIFGFAKGASGLVNSNGNRIWTEEPTASDATLVYGIMLTNIPPGKEWRYNINFSKTPLNPDSDLKIWPADGKVYQQDGNLYLTIECNSPNLCADGNLVMSSVTFTPSSAPLPDSEELRNESTVATRPGSPKARALAKSLLATSSSQKHAWHTRSHSE